MNGPYSNHDLKTSSGFHIMRQDTLVSFLQNQSKLGDIPKVPNDLRLVIVTEADFVRIPRVADKIEFLKKLSINTESK